MHFFSKILDKKKVSCKNNYIFFLLFLLAINTLVTSCNPYKNLVKVNDNSIPNSIVSPLNSKKEALLFRAQIKAYNKYISGILVVKALDSSKTRVVFTKETGTKLLDLELFKDTFQTLYVMSALNRPIVLKTIVEDIRMAFLMQTEGKTPEIYTFQNSLIYKFIDGKNIDYVYVQEKNIKKIDRVTTNGKKKVVILYSDYNMGIPNKVVILHKNFRMKMELSILKKE